MRWRREEGEMRDEGERRGGNVGRRREKRGKRGTKEKEEGGRILMEERRGGDWKQLSEEEEIQNKERVRGNHM